MSAHSGVNANYFFHANELEDLNRETHLMENVRSITILHF